VRTELLAIRRLLDQPC